MKKCIRLLVVLIGIVILTGCNKSEPEVVENNKISVLPVVQDLEETVVEEPTISPPNLETEQGVREYLIGEWTCEMEYMSNIVANMTIYEDMAFEISFLDSLSNESKGDYKGNIEFMRIWVDEEDAPDLLSLKFDDDSFSQYYFFHRTIYDGKRVMSLFFAGYEESIFDILIGSDDSDYTIVELMLEKITDEVTEEKPRKNDQFYAVFWGHGEPYESIWLDEVEWTPREEYEDPNYPVPMIVHENEVLESVLYYVDQDKKFDILGDDMFKGAAYYIETDENGNVVELVSADRKMFLEESSEEYMDEIEEIIFFIIEDIDDIQENLNKGMSILFTGETTMIDGEECYEIALGTDHDEMFVREIHYAVNISTEQVYEYDVLYDIWKEK